MCVLEENIIALFESGKISSFDLENAKKFCSSSKIGEYKCCVKTRYGFCCDLCLEDELLSLKSKGVNTINSCCGHGDLALASILTAGENSKNKMLSLGYIHVKDISERISQWKPKSIFMYQK